MAAAPFLERDSFLWEDTIGRLSNLSSTALRRNAELEAKLARLQLELSMYKQAHTAAVEAVEREKKAQSQDIPLILCLVDGASHVFNESYLVRGFDGGRCAGQNLTKTIAEYLSTQDELRISTRVSFWVSVYFNKKGLHDSLVSRGACTSEQFEDFALGFTQASPRFLLIDVGHGKEAAEAKMREYLNTYARFPQTLRVFFAGPCDSSFLPTLTSLCDEQLAQKLVLLHGRRDLSADVCTLGLPLLLAGDLFMDDSLRYSAHRVTPVTRSGTFFTDGLASPQSPSTPSSLPAVHREIDRSKPLHRQDPPPCNEFYLMSCTKNPCKYCHDYDLTVEQLEMLAINAKKAPCNFLKKGQPCTNGANCCWGHECPNGQSCLHYSKGKCWFKGEGMHSGPGTSFPPLESPEA